MGGWWAAGPKDLLIFPFASFAVVEDEAVRASMIVISSSVSAAYLIHILGAGLCLGYASETLVLRYLRGIARIVHAREKGGDFQEATVESSHGPKDLPSRNISPIAS